MPDIPDIELLLSAMGMDKIVQPPPPILYHYTSMEALLSIVSTGRIRATHIRYLNDLTEAEWLWDAITEQLELKKRSLADPKQVEYTGRILEMVENRRHLNEFVASFSENGDDLSQWRAYCAGGSGFSIGFETAALQTQWVANPDGGEAAFVGGSVKKVRYLCPENTSKFAKELDFLMKYTPSIESGFQGPVSKEQVLMGFLNVLAPSFKHPAFSAEKEWRLVLTKPHKPMPHQRFRPGKSSIVPFVEAILNRDISSKPLVGYMINRVIVGPTPGPQLSKEALQDMFLSVGHPEVKIEVSAIPYRHW